MFNINSLTQFAQALSLDNLQTETKTEVANKPEDNNAESKSDESAVHNGPVADITARQSNVVTTSSHSQTDEILSGDSIAGHVAEHTVTINKIVETRSEAIQTDRVIFANTAVEEALRAENLSLKDTVATMTSKIKEYESLLQEYKKRAQYALKQATAAAVETATSQQMDLENKVNSFTAQLLQEKQKSYELEQLVEKYKLDMEDFKKRSDSAEEEVNLLQERCRKLEVLNQEHEKRQQQSSSSTASNQPNANRNNKEQNNSTHTSDQDTSSTPSIHFAIDDEDEDDEEGQSSSDRSEEKPSVVPKGDKAGSTHANNSTKKPAIPLLQISTVTDSSSAGNHQDTNSSPTSKPAYGTYDNSHEDMADNDSVFSTISLHADSRNSSDYVLTSPAHSSQGLSGGMNTLHHLQTPTHLVSSNPPGNIVNSSNKSADKVISSSNLFIVHQLQQQIQQLRDSYTSRGLQLDDVQQQLMREKLEKEQLSRKNSELSQFLDKMKQQLRQEKNTEIDTHTINLEYLKNCIYQYMKTNEISEKVRLTPVIATILKFSSKEKAIVQTMMVKSYGDISGGIKKSGSNNSVNQASGSSEEGSLSVSSSITSLIGGWFTDANTDNTSKSAGTK